MEMAGGHILEQAAAQAQRIEAAVHEHGQERVEAVLDAALALEPHIDINQRAAPAALSRSTQSRRSRTARRPFSTRYQRLPGEKSAAASGRAAKRPAVPPQPEYDLLWFIAHYAPELERLGARYVPRSARGIVLLLSRIRLPDHERGLGVLLACTSAARSRLPAGEPLPRRDQGAFGRRAALRGRTAGGARDQSLPSRLLIWEQIVEKHGLEKAREIRREEDDFGFVRNYLDPELAERLGLFVYQARRDGEVKLMERKANAVREAILAPKFNYGAPRIHVAEMRHDGTLVLNHDHANDGRGLDLERASRVLHYVSRVWRRPVILHTTDGRGSTRELRADD